MECQYVQVSIIFPAFLGSNGPCIAMDFLSLPEGKDVELQTWSTGATGPSGPSGCDDRDFWDAVDPMTLSDVELASDACNLEISGDPAFFLTKFIGKKR